MGGNGKCNFHRLKLSDEIKKQISDAGFKDLLEMEGMNLRELEKKGIRVQDKVKKKIKMNDDVIRGLGEISRFLLQQNKKGIEFLRKAERHPWDGLEKIPGDLHKTMERLVYYTIDNGTAVSVYASGTKSEDRSHIDSDAEDDFWPSADEAAVDEVLNSRSEEEEREMEEDEKNAAMQNVVDSLPEDKREEAAEKMGVNGLKSNDVELDANVGEAVLKSDVGADETAQKHVYRKNLREPEGSPLAGLRLSTAEKLRGRYGEDVSFEKISKIGNEAPQDLMNLIRYPPLKALNQFLKANKLPEIPILEKEKKTDTAQVPAEELETMFRPLEQSVAEAKSEIAEVAEAALEAKLEAMAEKVLSDELRPYVGGLENLVTKFGGLIADASKMTLIAKVFAWLSQGNTEAKMKVLESLIGLEVSGSIPVETMELRHSAYHPYHRPPSPF